MLSRPHHWSADPRLARAHEHAHRAEVIQAELLYRAVLRDHADCVPAARAVASLAMDRGDIETAHQQLGEALKLTPNDTALLFDYAQIAWHRGDGGAAMSALEALLGQQPTHHIAWLVLGNLREAGGDAYGALRAWHQAHTRAQQAGFWFNRDNTEPSLLDAVMGSAAKLQRGRREALFQSFDSVRAAEGAHAVARVEHALRAHLGEIDDRPADPRQQPKFFYFPGLPYGPYHDPMLQPWAKALRDAWPAMRDEALALLAEDRDFESFLGLTPGQSRDGYIGGSNPNASWDAYFFYRHGKRFDDHHLRCPNTSAVLESIELCRVNRQAPEACFSVIRPNSTIMAHYGVTNTRLVMHLPLLVPPQCALNVIDAGEHHWREGELMMFDDTYKHEAWNRSGEPRLILLLDCWNPHLTPPERSAVKLLVEAIDSLEN
jgi:aspartate beta-hydroxylase